MTTRAAILVAQGFQDEEFVYPYYRMQEEGWEVDVLTPGGLRVTGKYGIPARATRAVESTFEANYRAIVIPGGFESPDRLRMIADVRAKVRAHFDSGALIAAICHGPWVCISAGVVKGKRVTGYTSIKDDLVNAGGMYQDDPVVTDGNLITAQHYRDNGAFMRAVVRYVNTQHVGPWLETHAVHP